jgi:hypothetical protein
MFYKITKLYNLNLEVFENTADIGRVISLSDYQILRRKFR